MPTQGDRAAWLLDITIAGQVWRFSDQAIEVPMDDGSRVVYPGGLYDLPEVLEELDDPASGAVGSLSVALSVLLPPNVHALALAGDLTTATAELSRWVHGTRYEARRVVVSGPVSDPEIGDPTEPVTFGLSPAVWSDSASIPDPSWSVVGENWADDAILSLPAGSLGLPYPLIFGQPGKVDTSIASAGWVTGSEGVWVDCRRDSFIHDGGSGAHPTGDRANLCLLIAGHHVSAESVYLNTDDYWRGERFRVLNTTDAAGHPVAVVPWYWAPYSGATPASELYWDSAENFLYEFDSGTGIYGLGSQDIDPSFNAISADPPRVFVGWRDEDGLSRGGLVSTASGRLVRDAGEVLSELLSWSSAPVDYGAFETAAAALSRFKFDFQVNATTTPWDFIRDRILPLLPLSLVMLPTGIAPIVWPFGAPASAAVARLDTAIDPGLERVSRRRWDRSNLVNDLSINYAASTRTGEYCAVTRLRGDVLDGGDAASGYADAYCAASQRRYRRADGLPLVVSESLDTDIVYDSATALHVLRWQVAARALSRVSVEYEGSERLYSWIRRGSVVLLTDERISVREQVAIVVGLRIVGSARVRLSLLLLSDPARDLVAA